MQLQQRTGIAAFSVLQDGSFRAIWYAGGLHEISRQMELLVLSLLIWETTKSPFQLGLVLVFTHLPRPAFSPFFGVIADRFSRFRVLLLSQSLNTLIAVGILLLIVFDLVQSWHIFLAVSLQGTTKSLEDPSRRTAIFDIVGEGRLVNAMSLDTMSNTLGKLVGPIIGGVLIQYFMGFTGAYIVLSMAHLLTMGLLTRVRVPKYQSPLLREPIWRGLGVAIRYALGNPMLIGMLFITIVMNALAFPVRQFIPAIGSEHLHVGPALVGLLAASEGFGQLAAAGVIASSRNLRYHGRLFTIGSLVVLIMSILFIWSPWYALSFALLTIGGLGQAGFSTMQSTIAMLSAPKEMRGRMMGLLGFCIGVGTPLGTAEIGAVAAAFGTQWAISVNVFAGLLLLLLSLVLTPLAWRPLTQPPPVVVQR